MKELREKGIYRLPDGNFYAAQSAGHGRYFLYLSDEGGISDPPRYLITQTGKIQPWVTEEWLVDDLVDTGKTTGMTKGI